MQGLGAGFLAGTAILSWYPDPFAFDAKGKQLPQTLGFRYYINGLRSPVMWSTLICGVYTGVECVFENLRDEDKTSTWVNSVFAGAATGVVMGSITKRFDIMATTALGIGTLMGMIEYNGQTVVSMKPRLPSLAKDATSPVDQLKERYPEYKDI